ETARSSVWRDPPCPPVAPSRRSWLEAGSLTQVAGSEYCGPTEGDAGEHFLPGDECSPAREARMGGSLNRSRPYCVHRSVRRVSTFLKYSSTPANAAATSVG